MPRLSEYVAYALDRKDESVKMGAEQAIKREIGTLERNTRQRTCLDAAMQDMASPFPVGETIHENLEVV